MLQFELAADLRNYVSDAIASNKKVGFVPTMGALHEGHLSLISRSVKENSVTICSVFVNPLQFNNVKDLENYPRDIRGDIAYLQSSKCDVVFFPHYNEVYPGGVPKPHDLGSLDRVMEGAKRPGHFRGVAAVISRLFDIVNPHRAYFGLKDYQQFLVIRKVVTDLGLPVQIIGCETVRESSGLAMSSRNLLLNKSGRETASLLYKSLLKAKKLLSDRSPDQIIAEISTDFQKQPNCSLDYFEIVNTEDLQKATDLSGRKSVIACVAAYVDQIRLIDNLILIK